MAKEAGIKKDSPGYAQAFKKLEEQYENDLDAAYAKLTFEEYNALNKESPESANRQAYDQLVKEFGAEEGKATDAGTILLSRTINGLSVSESAILQQGATPKGLAIKEA